MRFPIWSNAALWSSAGNLKKTVGVEKLNPEISDLENWGNQLGIPQKDLRLVDRQTMLLYRTVFDLLEGNPAFSRDSGAFHVAVGPARTNLPAMVKWANRIEPDSIWPMIQPAAAIGLLPNTPISWVSTKLGLRGEGAVWAGFTDAGHESLLAGISFLEETSNEAIVAGVNSPGNVFVESVVERDWYSAKFPPIEVGASLRLSYSGYGFCLRWAEIFPPSIEIKEIFSHLSSKTRTSAEELFSKAVIDGVNDRFDLRNRWGDAMPATFPFAIALAKERVFGEGIIPILVADHFGNIRVVIVEVPND
ncbi:hypothetical protein HYY75_12085 [bacterium]|nr:hypothetical protein [bacterium]